MIDIPLIRQDSKSDDCLRCCVLMVFKYFGDKITKDEVWKKLHVYKKHSGLWGAYFTDLGKIAIKKGYQATIHHYDWHFWNNNTVDSNNKSTKSLISALKELKKDKKEFGTKKEISKQISYLKLGGLFKFELPNLKVIDSYLHKNTPVIISLWGQDIYKNPKEDYRHTIIIKGKDGDNYLINDSLFALEKIDKDHLDYATKRRGGWMMVIEPKPDTSKLKQEILKF